MRNESALNLTKTKSDGKSLISSRDQKLLLILLIIAVIGLPYYFLIRPAFAEMEVTRTEISRLTSEKNRLEAVVAQIPEFHATIENYRLQVDEILSGYPRELPQEAVIIFINEMENLIPIKLSSVSFHAAKTELISVGFETAAAAEAGETGAAALGGEEEVLTATRIGAALDGVKMDVNYSFSTGYHEFKRFLSYIKENQERHVIPQISFAYNEETQLVSGSFSLSSYAVFGAERAMRIAGEPEFDLGNRNIFLMAPGLETDLVAEGRSDLFLEVSAAAFNGDAVTVGSTSDLSEASYLTDDENAASEVTITLTGRAGVYTAVYSINNAAGIPVTINRESGLKIDVISSPRSGSDDNVAVTLKVVNETDTHVTVETFYDDVFDPRITIAAEGDVRY